MDPLVFKTFFCKICATYPAPLILTISTSHMWTSRILFNHTVATWAFLGIYTTQEDPFFVWVFLALMAILIWHATFNTCNFVTFVTLILISFFLKRITTIRSTAEDYILILRYSQVILELCVLLKTFRAHNILDLLTSWNIITLRLRALDWIMFALLQDKAFKVCFKTI